MNLENAVQPQMDTDTKRLQAANGECGEWRAGGGERETPHPWPLSPSDAERGTTGDVGSGRAGVGARSHKKAEGGGRNWETSNILLSTFENENEDEI